mmetsp:Transcript_41063/g.64184  ORF Transcript_41063/g.64184 Transcript_41063/m.64184 type:complete len:149 (-) Transcript_41063:109-555(-)
MSTPVTKFRRNSKTRTSCHAEMQVCAGEDELQAILSKSGDHLVVAFFHAEWCYPSQKLKPFMKELLPVFPHCTFLELDFDKFESFAEKHNVQAAPTVLFLRHAAVVHNGMVVGADLPKIKEHLTEHSQVVCSAGAKVIALSSMLAAAR